VAGEQARFRREAKELRLYALLELLLISTTEIASADCSEEQGVPGENCLQGLAVETDASGSVSGSMQDGEIGLSNGHPGGEQLVRLAELAVHRCKRSKAGITERLENGSGPRFVFRIEEPAVISVYGKRNTPLRCCELGLNACSCGDVIDVPVSGYDAPGTKVEQFQALENPFFLSPRVYNEAFAFPGCDDIAVSM